MDQAITKIKEVINTYNIAPYLGLEKVLHGIQFKCLEYATSGPFAGTCIIVGNRRYQVVSGWQYLSSTSQKVYDQNNSFLYTETITNFEFGNENHIQMTKSSTTGSDGKTYSSEYFYPEDYTAVSGSHPVAQLKDRYMHNNLVEEIKKTDASVTAGTRFEYVEDQGNILRNKVYKIEAFNPFSYTPASDASGSGGNYAERIEFPSYDEHGNLLELKDKDGAYSAFTYGHRQSLPTSRTLNAASDQVAYTSFDYGVDPDPDNSNKRIEGNWEFITPGNSGGGWSKLDAKTGAGQYDLNSQRSLATTVGITGDYLLSFWAKKNNPINISVSSTLIKNELRADGWTLYVYRLSLTNGQVLSLNGANAANNYIDELRLHPIEA